MANYIFKANPRQARRLPPKEWFYYAYERTLAELKRRGIKPRPPYKTLPLSAKAIVAGGWWGTFDGLKPVTKQRILTEIITNRAKNKVAVVTGRKGAVKRSEVTKAIGRAKTAALYKKLKLTKSEIQESKVIRKSRIAARRPLVELREVASNPMCVGNYENNPELLMVFGNPGAPVMTDKKRPPSIKAIMKTPEYKAAVKKYKQFHGKMPKKVTLQFVEADVPAVTVAMGEAPEVVYQVGTGQPSNKQKRVPFKHDFKGKVHAVTDAKGKVIYFLPDSKKGKKGFRVEDWVRG